MNIQEQSIKQDDDPIQMVDEQINISESRGFTNIEQDNIFLSCEEFCTKMRHSNPNMFSQLASMTKEYAGKTQMITQFYHKMSDLVCEDIEFINEINKFLAPEARIFNDSLGDIRSFNNKIIKIDDNPKTDRSSLDFSHFFDATQTWQQTREIQQEIIYFDKLRSRIMNHFQDKSQFDKYFTEIMKLIFLFHETIITQTEFMDIITESLQWIEKEYIDEFRVLAQNRLVARKQQSNLFKPLKDTDFTNSQRLTKSYVAMHQGYAKNEIQTRVLNQSWVSVPFGSEDYSFSIMRKNTYEEQLFKSEDERYEFDLYLQQMKRTQKLLHQIIDQNGENCQNQIKQIIDLRIIHQLYRNQSLDHHEIIQHLLTNPLNCAKVLVKRVLQKISEIQGLRNNKAKLIWDQVSQINFHRSLDHRSFYFKKNDKIFLNAVRFLKEPEERLKVINQHFNYFGNKDDEVVQKKKGELAFHFNIEDLTVYLNTLDQLTSIKPQLPQVSPQIIPQPNISNALQIPLFIMWFGDTDILQESLQFLLQYVWIMGGANVKEKKQISRSIVKISNVLFKLAIIPLDLSQLVLQESQLRQEVSLIEQKTQQNSFNYLLPPQDDMATQIASNLTQLEIKKRKIGDQINQNSGGSSPIAESVLIHPETQGELQSDFSEILTQNQFPDSTFDNNSKASLSFIPNEKGIVLYVNHGIYTFIRFLNCIYQRMQIAKTISCNLEINEKTEKLSTKEKISIGLQKYQLFKSCLFLSLRSKDFKYEDYLRSLFDKQGFVFSTLEKLLQDTCKQLILCHSNKLTQTLLNYSLKRVGDTKQFYKNFFTILTNNTNCQVKGIEIEKQILYELANDKTEDMQLANLSFQIFETQEKIHEKPIFRICYYNDSAFISLIPSIQKIQDLQELIRSHEYRDTLIQETNQKKNKPFKVYLERNLRRSCRPRQVFATNGMSFVIGEFKNIYPISHAFKEDVIIEFGTKPNNLKRIFQQVNVRKMMNLFK